MQEEESITYWRTVFSTLGVFFLVALVFYRYGMRNFGYLERYGVRVVKRPIPFIGTRPLFWSKPFHQMDMDLCTKHGRVFGLYEGLTPTLVITDPDLLKTVIVESIHSFQQLKHPGLHNHPINQLFLGSMHSHRWRFVHSGLYNVFSQEKIRELIPAMDDNADEWIRYLLLEISERGVDQTIAIDQWAFSFCVHVLATSIFGLEVNVLADPNHPFIMCAKALLDPPLISRWTNSYLPRLWQLLSPEKEAMNYFVQAAVTALVQRRLSGQMKNDFLELLLEAQEEEKMLADAHLFTSRHKIKAVFTDEMLVAHLVAFVSSALAQVTSALTFVVLMLAQHPDKQEMAFNEVSQHVRDNDGIVDNTVLVKLHYVDMVIAETLRLYPPVARNVRECIKDHYLRTCPVRKGMHVLVPVYTIHRDPMFFKDPEEFRPERFDGRNNPNPLTYIPFGVGPKHCIGRELAIMQVKIAVVYFIQHFLITRPKDAEEVAFQFGSVVLRPSRPVWINLYKRDATEPKPPIDLYDEYLEAKRRRRTPPSELSPIMYGKTLLESRTDRCPIEIAETNKSDEDSEIEDDEDEMEEDEGVAGTPVYLTTLIKNVLKKKNSG